MAHLVGLLSSADPRDSGVSRVVLWASERVVERIPAAEWLEIRSEASARGSLLRELKWQAFDLGREVSAAGCDILFSADASTLARHEPLVVLSQDMLSYEPGVMQMFGWGAKRMRLEAILRVQNAAFRRAQGVVFLTDYASRVIQASCGALRVTRRIAHGVDPAFGGAYRRPAWPVSGDRPVRIVYVSNAAPYKYQWNVVRACASLVQSGCRVELELVGGGEGPAQRRVELEMRRAAGVGAGVRQLPFMGRDEMLTHVREADLFVFASGCENLPVTLLEGMAAGLPIACSNRGPMPEVLGDAGVYFDPAQPKEIVRALKQLMENPELRARSARKAAERAAQFTWSRCAAETWRFLADVAEESRLISRR